MQADIAVRPDALPQSRIELALQITVALGFALLLINWPGAVLLSIIYLLAGCAAVVAGVNLLSFFDRTRGGSWWLQIIGGVALIAGIGALSLSGGALAVVPAVAGSWLAARAKDGWFFAPSIACLTTALLMISTFSDQPVSTAALLGVHCISTGILLIALSPRPTARAPALHLS